MRSSARWTPLRATLALALLGFCVLGALVWVSIAALALEAKERTAAFDSDRAHRIRLALWRLDAAMLAPLGVENNRPFTNYTTLAPPAPLVLDSQNHPLGDPGVVPSPLLGAELPPWMIVHVELDRSGGWRSPQVIPYELAQQLKVEPLLLSLSNCTSARRSALQVLRTNYPTEATINVLAAIEATEPILPPRYVPIPQPNEPASEKPGGPDDGSMTSGGTSGMKSAELAAREKARDDSFAARGSYESPTGSGRGYVFVPREAMLHAKPLDPNASKPANATSMESDGVLTVPFPQMPGATEWSQRFGGFVRDRTERQREPMRYPPLAKSPALREPWLAEAKPIAPNQPVSEIKYAPNVVPVAIRLGPMRPRWLIGSDGVERLLVVRRASLGEREIYQGVHVDWPKLRDVLIPLIADLVPSAELDPIRTPEEGESDRSMTALPIRLVVTDESPGRTEALSPLRLGLGIAWGASLMAMLAVALGAKAMLAMAERRVRFASAVTHELRTPLTALQLHLDLLTSGLVRDEEKKAEYLRTLSDETDRLNRLVENVFEFAKLEKSSVRRQARPVPVAQLLATLERTWTDRLMADGYTLLANAIAGPQRAALADPGVLEQVLGNLIDNARKYAKSATDRRIWVWAKPGPAGAVVLEVEDRGPGVPEAEREAIFKPFARGTQSTDTGGAGLGLALAKDWAEAFGGSLTYHPAAGGIGACFRLMLPGTPG